MQRRALLAAVATLPLAGCGGRLSYGEQTPTRDPTETPVRAVPATFETTDVDTHPSDDDRVSARSEDDRVVVTGRTSKDGCHRLVLGDVTLTDRRIGIVVDQRATVDLAEHDCGGTVVPYRVVLAVARERVDTVAVEHRRPEFGAVFETTVGLPQGTETHRSPVESKPAEEP